MATNRDLLKEAIADAKTVKDTAIANAKAALEEAFTPYLKEKLAAKINEMDEAEEMDEEMYDEAEKMDEMKGEELDEVSLDELLAELELDEYAEEQPNRDMDGDGDVDADDVKMMKEAKEEEEMSIEDMSEDDLKSFIEDVIKDMVSAGELEAGHEGMENEEGVEGEEVSDEEEMSGEEELDEEINLDELLAEVEKEEVDEILSEEEVEEAMFGYMGPKEKARKIALENEFDKLKAGGAIGDKNNFLEKAEGDNHGGKLIVQKAKGNNPKLAGKNVIIYVANPTMMQKLAAGTSSLTTGGGSGEKNAPLEEAYAAIKILKSELNEINLLNAKLLYTNKIFRNKSLTESQKIKVLTAFDKATTKQEAQLIYETLQESLKVSITKSPIKESLGSASKILGNASAKPIIEVDGQFARWQQLAGINKNK